MRILVLGGTSFLGRHAVASALARGHSVTLMNRGRTAPGLFVSVDTIRGDRERDAGLLRGRSFDAVLDTCGFTPRAVRATLEALGPRSDAHYVFVSTISVYADFAAPVTTETRTVAPAADDVELSMPLYGELKRACELVVAERAPNRSLCVRAGLIVGPHDYDRRFRWWLRRVAAGGPMVAPAPVTRPVQLIDARDLGDWLVCAAETRLAGVFDITGPSDPLSFGELFETMKEVTGSDAEPVLAPDDVLEGHNVHAFSELPFWVPRSHRGILEVDVAPAVAAGLTFRPLVDTVRDTWFWMRDGGEAEAEASLRHRAFSFDAGLSPERERAILEALGHSQERASGT